MRFTILIFLLLGPACFGQNVVTRTDKITARIESEVKSMKQISIYFIFDTSKRGQIMVKNSYLGINLTCKGGYNDEGKVEYHFKNDSLKLIVLFDYDPTEGSASRETKYYFHKDELIFIHDINDEYKRRTPNTMNAMARTETKTYLDKGTVVKHLFRTADGLPGPEAVKDFQASPFTETETFDSELIQTKDQLLDIIKPEWITDGKVKIKK